MISGWIFGRTKSNVVFSDRSNVWALLRAMMAPSLSQAAALVMASPLVFLNTGLTGHYLVPSTQTFNF